MIAPPPKDSPEGPNRPQASRRSGLVEALADAADGLAAQSSRFNGLVAQRAGIVESDLLCLRLILSQGGATAGELTAATGLTGGATTGTMNRLEARGLAQREPVPGDRRKTIVRPRAIALQEIAPIYDMRQGSLENALAGYSDAELQNAHKIIGSIAAALLEETGRLASEPVPRREAAWESRQKPS
jgi:DNA-binding MarR family transcriptional regulator